jgi:hypothetical protein
MRGICDFFSLDYNCLGILGILTLPAWREYFVETSAKLK